MPEVGLTIMRWIGWALFLAAAAAVSIWLDPIALAE
jgi:hypothetical protein